MCVYTAAMAQSSYDKAFVPPNHGPMVYGCEVNTYDNGYTHVDVWVDYANGWKEPTATKHGWTRLYSMRDNRMRALKDCDEWMKQTKKALTKKAKGH